MTVNDLIVYLEKLPKDTVVGVIYQAFSEYSILEEGDMSFVAVDGSINGRPRHPNCPPQTRYVLRHGKIMEYDPDTWPPDEVPHFVSVLVLPGN